MGKKRGQEPKKITNRRAAFDYELGEGFVLGIILNGRETKSLRLGHGQLQGSYVTIKNGEVWLINAAIHGTNGIPISDSEATRDRKLLAKKREIQQLLVAKQQGKQLVPTDILTNGRFIKLRIALGISKKHFDKRQTIKRREDSIASQRAMRKSWH